MSSIEARLMRDIAAVTGGVIVTDSDLHEARVALVERTESKRPRGRFHRFAPAAAAAAVLVLVGVTAFVTLADDDKAIGPAGSAPVVNDPDANYLIGDAPTVQLLQGVWRVDNTGIVLRFGADGTVQFDKRGTFYSDPATVGTYVVDGDRITVTTTVDRQPACVGTTFTIRASIPPAGALRFATPRTDASGCTPIGTGRGALEQLLPAGPGVAQMVFSQEPGFQPLSDKTILPGIWLAEGGGHLLEMDPGGAYFMADASGDPVDRGTWSFAGSALTLTSSTGSTACRPGDVFILAAVQQVSSLTDVVRGTVTKNDCDAAWTPATWFLLQQDGA